MKKILLNNYENISILLALITIIINLLDIFNFIDLNFSNLIYIDNFILLYFILEFFIRFYYSLDKKTFLKNNVFDLIAIIPFNSFFKVFRLFKLFRFIKLTKFTKLIKFFRFFKTIIFFKKIKKTVIKFLFTNNLIYMLGVCSIIILLGAFGIYSFEKNITVNTFIDSIWWSFVTATTVGYGDVSPSTLPGRIVAVILMITGIGTIGSVTGTFATFFIKDTHEISLDNKLNEYIKISNELTENEKIEVINFINYIKYKRNNIK